MTPMQLGLPKGVVVRGIFYQSDDPASLTQDMVEIDLPSGFSVEAGWFPEADPEGSYRVTVFRDYWRNQPEQPRFAKNAEAAAAFIRDLVDRYFDSRPKFRVGAVNTQVTVVVLPPFRPADRNYTLVGASV